MASQTSICNLTLIRLAQQPITDIDEGTVVADKLKAIYDDVRDYVLTRHPWNFAMKRAALAQLSETPAWGWSYYYQLPTDCLRIWQMNELENEDLWEIEAEGRLATDEGSANIMYIARVEEAGRYSPGFVSALAARLAEETALDLTGRPEVVKLMMQKWPTELAVAVAQDSQEKGPISFLSEAWLNARI
jgi:hypothetical protein